MTELMLVNSVAAKHFHFLFTYLVINGDCKITFMQSVKNLGFVLDSHHIMDNDVSTAV